jgi:hypothetical protein
MPADEGGARQAASSSLASLGRSSPCPRVKGWQYQDGDPPFWRSCKANICPHCGPVKAWKTALAVDRARPERLIRFSLVGDDYKARARRVRQAMTELRERGYEIEYWGVFERNPKGTGHHFHAWSKGSYIPQRALQEVCEGHGMGIPDIRKWRPDRRGSAGYGLKGSARYGLKADEVLELNGGRFGTWTRGFFGMPYKQALAEALHAHYGR